MMEFEELVKGINKQAEIYGDQERRRGNYYMSAFHIEHHPAPLAMLKVIKMYVDRELLLLEKKLLVQIKNRGK